MSGARPRRRLDDVRRPQILDTAVELVREKGLWSVRLSDIARRAGMSATSIVYYFGTKDALLADAIAAADDAFYGTVDEELARLAAAHDRLGRLVARSSASDWLLWMELWVYARHHPDTAAAQRRFHDRWRATIEAVVRHGVATGEWTVADVRGVALRLAALTDGLAVQMVLGDPEHTAGRYIEMTLAAAALELGADVARLRRAAGRPRRSGR
jgi:AcrR family transcriptional regulator